MTEFQKKMKQKALETAARGREAAKKSDTNIVAENSEADLWDEHPYNKEFESEDEFNAYTVITDGKMIPHQLKYTRMAYLYFLSYKEETHVTASMVGALYTAVLIGTGRVWTYTSAPVSMFMGYIGKTGTAKDPILKALRRVDHYDSETAGICKNGSKVMSAPALDTLLRSEGSNAVILMLDELGDNLKEILSGRSTKAGLKPVLKEAYSVNAGDIHEGGYYSDQGGKLKKVEPYTIESLSLGLIGVSTKEQLLRAMDASHLSDGFINRWVFVDGVLHEGIFNGEFSSGIPIQLQQHLDTFQIRDGDIKRIFLEDDAKAFYQMNIGQVSKKIGRVYEWAKDDEAKIEISSRVRENALRLATALAFFEHFEKVPLWLLEWSFNFVFESAKHFYYIFNNQESDEKKAWDKLISKCERWLDNRVGKTLSKNDLRLMTGYRDISHNISQKGHILSTLEEMERLVKQQDGKYFVKK